MQPNTEESKENSGIHFHFNDRNARTLGNGPFDKFLVILIACFLIVVFIFMIVDRFKSQKQTKSTPTPPSPGPTPGEAEAFARTRCY